MKSIKSTQIVLSFFQFIIFIAERSNIEKSFVYIWMAADTGVPDGIGIKDKSAWVKYFFRYFFGLRQSCSSITFIPPPLRFRIQSHYRHSPEMSRNRNEGNIIEMLMPSKTPRNKSGEMFPYNFANYVHVLSETLATFKVQVYCFIFLENFDRRCWIWTRSLWHCGDFSKGIFCLCLMLTSYVLHQ